MTKYLTSFLTLALVLCLFAGCVSQAPDVTAPTTIPTQPSEAPVITEPTEPVAEEEIITIRWWAYEDEVVKPLLLQWLDRFHKEYPTIRVDMTWLSADRGGQKVNSAFATGGYPDILWDTYSNLSAAVDGGLTVSLEPAMADITGLSVSEEGLVEQAHHYLWTSVPAGSAIACNMTLARELGIEQYLPEDGISWSYEDFLACLRAAKKAGKFGVDMYAGSCEDDLWYYSWFMGAGVEILDTKKGTLLCNHSKYKKNALRVLELFETIVDEDLCQNGAEHITASDARAIWYTGEMLFSHASFADSAMLQQLYENGTSQVGEFSLFAQPTPDGVAGGGECALGSSKGIVAFDTHQGANLDAVYTAIRYLYSQEGGFFQTLAEKSPAAVPFLDWVKPEISELDPVVAQLTLERGAAYTLEKGRSDWGQAEPWFSSFRQTLPKRLASFFDGDITAKKFLSKWESDAKTAIAGYETGKFN